MQNNCFASKQNIETIAWLLLILWNIKIYPSPIDAFMKNEDVSSLRPSNNLADRKFSLGDLNRT